MKKIGILLFAISILITQAFALPAKTKVDFKKTIHCAVMTNNVLDIAKATKNHMYADYKGKRYFFCCDGCPQAFKKNPAKYAKHDSIPIPKKKTVKAK
jgi:YHS domain-containing protein